MVTFHDLAVSLVGCVQAQLDPPAEVACVVAGEIVWDACDCGQLAISLSRVWLSRVPPAEATGDQAPTGPCGAPYLVGELTIQVVRCVAADRPSCEQQTADAAHGAADALAVLAGIDCCLRAAQTAAAVVGWQAGPVTLRGPQGGCYGPGVRLLVWTVNPCGECP